MIIRENIPLSRLTTMRLGGPARYVIDIEAKDDIVPAFTFVKERNLPFFILGGGANTIAGDDGFNGAIIRNIIAGITKAKPAQQANSTALSTAEPPTTSPATKSANTTESATSDTTTITAMGGTEWDTVVAYTTDHNLTGIEALSKIPGCAGAAPVQNIGAYGQEVADTFTSAEVYDISTGEFRTLSKSDFHFSYRHSILNTTERGRYFVISITLTLKKGQMPRPFYNSIERYIEAHHLTDSSPQSIRNIVSAIRSDKLPDPTTTPSAGSFFKNIYLTESQAATAEAKGYPVYHGHDGLKINSGWLIEQAGFKGQLLHGIRVSPHAALVLINESATSYQDLASARAEIITKVKSQFSYQLEQEPVELSNHTAFPPSIIATQPTPTTTNPTKATVNAKPAKLSSPTPISASPATANPTTTTNPTKGVN